MSSEAVDLDTDAGDALLPEHLPGSESIALGRATTGRAILLLRFVSTWREDADIQSAYFVMDAVEGADSQNCAIGSAFSRQTPSGPRMRNL